MFILTAFIVCLFQSCQYPQTVQGRKWMWYKDQWRL